MQRRIQTIIEDIKLRYETEGDALRMKSLILLFPIMTILTGRTEK